jgi:hypothetical protein
LECAETIDARVDSDTAVATIVGRRGKPTTVSAGAAPLDVAVVTRKQNRENDLTAGATVRRASAWRLLHPAASTPPA